MLEDFSTTTLGPHWIPTTVGNGFIQLSPSILRMGFHAAQEGHYSNGQIDDYTHLSRSHFPWKPPLRMLVRARSSHPATTMNSYKEPISKEHLHGTAGFGFWNYPFSIHGDILMLPEAVWFFYASPPSNMALVPHTPGWGWKAQVVHAMRPEALAALLPTALTTGWARLTGQTRYAARWLQHFSGASEALLPVEMDQWHTYKLEWHSQQAHFWVDETHILTAPSPPRRPLGFVTWLDNQYAIATPQGILRFGTVSSGPQWLEIDTIQIEALT